jgi:hypothetical protein
MPLSPPEKGSRRLGFLRVLPVAVALVLGLLLLDSRRPGSAEPPETGNHMVYVSITGEGPSAKAWYDGATPTGVPVQTALDHFSARGYRVSAVSEARERLEGEALVWLLVLERPAGR